MSIGSSILAAPRAVAQSIAVAYESFHKPDYRQQKHQLSGMIQVLSSPAFAIPLFGAIPAVHSFATGEMTTDGRTAREGILGLVQFATTATILGVAGVSGIIPAMAVGLVIAIPLVMKGHENAKADVASLPTRPFTPVGHDFQVRSKPSEAEIQRQLDEAWDGMTAKSSTKAQ